MLVTLRLTEGRAEVAPAAPTATPAKAMAELEKVAELPRIVES